MKKTLALLLLLIAAAAAAGVQGDDTWAPVMGVRLDRDPQVPLQTGELVDIVLDGFERFERVSVVIFERGLFDRRNAYDVSGIIGRLTIRAPCFPPDTVVQLQATGVVLASSPKEVVVPPPLTSRGGRVAYSNQEYRYGISSVFDNLPLSSSGKRAVRSGPGSPSVYINGHPQFLHMRQMITVVWQGFPSDSTVCVELRCPESTYNSYFKPAYAEYTFFEVINLRPKKEFGCYVVAFECSIDGGPDPSTLVRSEETYILLLQ